MTEYLLARGLSCTDADFSGRTPFHWAALRTNFNALFILTNALKTAEAYHEQMNRQDSKGCSVIYYTTNNKQTQQRSKDLSHSICTNLDLMPQSKLRMIWRMEFAAGITATWLVPFLIYWWRVIVFGLEYGWIARLAPLALFGFLVWFFVSITKTIRPRVYDKESPIYFGNIVGIVSICISGFFLVLLPGLSYGWLLPLYILALASHIGAPYLLWKVNSTPPTIIHPTDFNSKMDFATMPTEQFCGTCLIRKPLRSKHCK